MTQVLEALAGRRSPDAAERRRAARWSGSAAAGAAAPAWWSRPGRVLTVAHVLRGDEVAVTFADGRTCATAACRAPTPTSTSP